MRTSCAQIMGLIMLVNTNLVAIIAFATPYWAVFNFLGTARGLWAACGSEDCIWAFENDFAMQDYSPGRSRIYL